jgi:hypothetical protein
MLVTSSVNKVTDGSVFVVTHVPVPETPLPWTTKAEPDIVTGEKSGQLVITLSTGGRFRTVSGDFVGVTFDNEFRCLTECAVRQIGLFNREGLAL